MEEPKKLLGEERRAWILHCLKNSSLPITGSELAVQAKVSRQVIVGDITILKAKNEPIMATSQGYIYFKHAPVPAIFERTIACKHSPSDTERELNLFVDYGVIVKNVRVEHPIYGDLEASLMVSNRLEVHQFIEKIKASKASYLSELTDGFHLHTIASDAEENLKKAVAAMKAAGFLVE